MLEVRQISKVYSGVAVVQVVSGIILANRKVPCHAV